MYVLEVGWFFTLKVITAPVSEELEVSGFYWEDGALFITTFVYRAIVFSSQMGASEHYTAAISAFVALAPAQGKLCADIALSEMYQVESAELAYTFFQFLQDMSCGHLWFISL